MNCKNDIKKIKSDKKIIFENIIFIIKNKSYKNKFNNNKLLIKEKHKIKNNKIENRIVNKKNR